MKIGDYVRTKGNVNYIATISKVVEIDYNKKYFRTDDMLSHEIIEFDEILKSSPNIIDLIEVGDYVNGDEVDDFYIKYDEKKDIFNNIGVITIDCYLGDVNYSWILEKDIKSIVTKEQFASMEYRIGDK